MGRPKEGWALRRKRGERCWRVRFTVGGRQQERSTGETSEPLAAKEAERIYAAAVGGEDIRRRQRPRPAVLRGSPIGEVAAQWLSATASLRDVTTQDTYALYCSAHWAPHFKTIDGVTDESVAEYTQDRLAKVKAKTVNKELGALRGFMAWAEGRGLCRNVNIPGVPKRTPGVAHPKGKRTHTELSPAEVQKLLKALPVRTEERIIRGETKLGGWPARAFFTVLYETTLRPETLWAIKVPQNYTRGSKTLLIDTDQDKARFGRRVPLSAKARKALDEVCPAKGQIFARYTYRKVAKAAAAKALSPAKAATFHPYDLRAAGGTHRLERGAPIPGVQWLFGHKSVATTAKYIRASERSAEEAVSGRRPRSP